MTYGEKKQKELFEKFKRGLKSNEDELYPSLIEKIVGADNHINTNDLLVGTYIMMNELDKREVADEGMGQSKKKKKIREVKCVPPALKREPVEAFFKALEKETYIDDDGIEHKILDRSSLPWKFLSKTLAGYIASMLMKEPFKLKKAYHCIEDVAGYDFHTIGSMVYKSPAPDGYKVVNDVLKKFK